MRTMPDFERAAAGALHAVADADAEIAAFGSRARLPLGEAGIADGVHRELLTGREVAAVERDAGARARLQRRGVGHLVGRHQIAAPHLGAVERKRVGDGVEHALHRERALGIAGAAHRHGRDLVGLDHLHVELVGRQDVGTRQRRRRVERQVDALRRVGALVVDHAAAHAEQPAVVVERDLEIPILVALLDRRQEMLAPILDPFDRPPQHQRRRRRPRPPPDT